MESTTHTNAKIVVEPWQHFCGPRLTHQTYEGRIVFGTGETVRCGHHGHRSSLTALRCSEAVLKKMARQ